jgi:hypothetical protein
MEVVDRRIYPKATAQPFTLQWPKGTAERNSFGEMMGRPNE